MNTPFGRPDAGASSSGSGATPEDGAPHDGAGLSQRTPPTCRVLNLNPAAIPGDMREARRWVVWNLETRHGKPTKVPYQAVCPSVCASSIDATTWSAFDTAQAALADGKADGLGFVLGDGFAGVDLDACRDPNSGAITAEATAIIHELSSYTEISPSGTGVHILLRGRLPAGGRRKGHIEIYADGRYFTVTGHRLEVAPAPVEERSAELAALHGRLFGADGDNGHEHRPAPRPVGFVADDDAALLEGARRAHHAPEF